MPLKKYKRRQVKQQKPLKMKHINPLTKYKKHNQTSEGIERNHLDLKMELETNEKMNSQRQSTLEIENLEKRSKVIDVSTTDITQGIEEKILAGKDTIENIDKTVKETAKCQKILTQNIQEIQDTTRRPNLRIIGIEESGDFQLIGPVNIFNKIIEEIFPNLKKEMPINL